MAASAALKSPKARGVSSIEGTPLSQSELSLPLRDRRSHPSAASLYASTLSPPGSRSQSPAPGRPRSRMATGSIFGGNSNNALALVEGAGTSPGDPLNLIMKALVPRVAVYTSDDTDQLLKEKGFDLGLWELLRPFGERIQGKVIIRDSTGASRTYEDYSIHFVRFGEDIEHPESLQPAKTNGVSEKGKPDEMKKGTPRRGADLADVESVVNRHLEFAEESTPSMSQSPIATKHGLDVEVPSPYYSLYLRRLLSGLPIAPHETFAHPVACVIAISSRNPAPIETLRRLYNESSAGEKRLPNWVDSEYLRYYVLVHDEETDDITKSMALFDQMKRNLGLHCHLLRIRGTQSAATDDDSIPIPISEWMSASEELDNIRRHDLQDDFEDLTRYIFESDATAIRTFIREMVTQSIIPTMERHVSVWNDQVASRRRGVAGRFLGLTRRWGFGSSSKSSSGGQGSGSNYDSLGFYRQDAPEAIMRKLADYAFMLRDWKLAYSTYDLLRGDFNSDKAWKYHAAANEMAAISLLILPQNLSAKTRAETVDTMLEAAFYSYLTRCSAPYGAARSLALGLELLRLRGGSSIDDAAKWGARLLESKILGPVGEALIKERLAVCYASKDGLGMQHLGSRRRKSALWSVLGADAWLAQSKYIQAQRCLNEARKMYGELSSEHGIDKFDQASAFVLGIGQRLNEQLEAADNRDSTADDDDDEESVDVQSEVLNTRGRRFSTMGVPGATTPTLEAAPLRNLEADGSVDDGVSPGPDDDFG
ncbi:ER-golgi trafficking TRAPP I complex 85 kDa subunit-domain-containing protein [Xylariales sp. PMI_506]|nr:ER-golgi trafficking TRAPP I complex 85 kDa subunit-domain-containing protein [Xylariales sp. PMI_506]